MSPSSKYLVIAGAITGIVLLGILFARRTGNGPGAEVAASIAEPNSSAPEQTNPPSFFTKRAAQPAPRAAASHSGQPVVVFGSDLATGWEEKMDVILGSAAPDPEKAKQMLEMFPRLPADGQEEVARHLSNLLPDQDYGLMHSYLTNAALPEDVLDVLLDDALNRPNSLKLPALLEVARTAQHPKATEAKDFLELLLEEDYGNDWNKWQAKMQDWLKDNPD
jgi:hypothetical protein